MSGNENNGRAVLLSEEHLQETNPWGHPVVGWVQNSEGFGGIHNPRGFGLPRIVLQKFIDGVLRSLYDQPVIVENAGSIVIAEYEGRIGMIENFRMVGERLLPEAGANYIKELQGKKLWSALIETLGAWRWECPRGMVPPGTAQNATESLESFVVRTAKLEALEEGGFVLEGARLVGRVNTNPTFFPHA